MVFARIKKWRRERSGGATVPTLDIMALDWKGASLQEKVRRIGEFIDTFWLPVTLRDHGKLTLSEVVEMHDMVFFFFCCHGNVIRESFFYIPADQIMYSECHAFVELVDNHFTNMCDEIGVIWPDKVPDEWIIGEVENDQVETGDDHSAPKQD